MSSYYVTKKVDLNGMHIVHEEGCKNMPEELNITYMGEYDSDIEAVEACKKNYYHNSDGCYTCCPDANFR